MSTIGAILARHVDEPDDRHRLILLAPLSLRCLDCTQTIDLRSATAVAGSTSPTSKTRQPPGTHDPGQCLRHAGEWADTCRACRAEQLEDPRTPEQRAAHTPRADPDVVAARAAEIRAQLAARRAPRSTP